MTTFDEILPKLQAILHNCDGCLDLIRPLLVNRDLNGKVRLIVDASKEADSQARTTLDVLAAAIADQLRPHTYAAEQILLFEAGLERLLQREIAFPLAECKGVYVVDRLATEGDWAAIAAPKTGVPRIVFFSIKGGVGRSTAIAASAWALAEKGKRVMVLDLDLESPGLSAALLAEDRRPAYGITDWLVEDLVDNADAIFAETVASSDLSRNGDIFVVPAHGACPGEYIAKLGRVWMPKISVEGVREVWSKRLGRFLDALEKEWRPDVVFLDSRAGIDEVASVCLTSLGATAILLFAIDGDQTWSAYRALFGHWRKMEVAREIRERLQLIGAMVPEIEVDEYLSELRQRAWNLFSEELYDEVPPGELPGDALWSFDETDESAPHYPWIVRWHRGFATLPNLHTGFEAIARQETSAVFGSLIDGLAGLI